MTTPDGMGKYIALLFKIGLVMILSITFFFNVGLMLIKTFHWPIMTLIGFILVGVFSGFVYIYYQIKSL